MQTKYVICIFQVLDLDPSKAFAYTKSEIKASWFERKSKVDDPLQREQIDAAYGILRHTESRHDYIHKNLTSRLASRNRSALLALTVFLN